MSMWDDFDLTPRQKELLGRAGEVCAPFPDRAADNDRDAEFPHANYADLNAAGFLALCIPEANGGLGADYETYSLVAAEIARHDPATALTFNMHSCSMLWSGPLADDLPMQNDQRDTHNARRAAIYESVVDGGAIFAQPFSEPNSAAASGKAPFGTTARKVDGGWLVQGKKHFASLAGAADYYAVLCTEDKGDDNPDVRDTMLLAVPGNADGFNVVGGWDTLGMRPTVSKNLDIQDVFVSDDAQLLPRGAYYEAASRWPHMFMTLSPSYMGLSQAAYDFTVAYLRGEAPGAKGARRNAPVKQFAIAEMKMKLEQSRAMFMNAVRDARYNPSKETRLRAYVAQYTVMENAPDITRLAIRTCGGSTIFKSMPLERYYRDARCGSLMLPWSAEACLERLGRECLYEPGERD